MNQLKQPIVIEEQQLPVEGGIQTHLLAKERINRVLDRQNAKGFAKYGRYLNMFNGRNIIQDMEEEMADQNNYFEVMAQEYMWMRRLLFELDDNLSPVSDYLQYHLNDVELNFIRSYKEE